MNEGVKSGAYLSYSLKQRLSRNFLVCPFTTGAEELDDAEPLQSFPEPRLQMLNNPWTTRPVDLLACIAY